MAILSYKWHTTFLLLCNYYNSRCSTSYKRLLVFVCTMKWDSRMSSHADLQAQCIHSNVTGCLGYECMPDVCKQTSEAHASNLVSHDGSTANHVLLCQNLARTDKNLLLMHCMLKSYRTLGVTSIRSK